MTHSSIYNFILNILPNMVKVKEYKSFIFNDLGERILARIMAYIFLELH